MSNILSLMFSLVVPCICIVLWIHITCPLHCLVIFMCYILNGCVGCLMVSYVQFKPHIVSSLVFNPMCVVLIVATIFFLHGTLLWPLDLKVMQSHFSKWHLHVQIAWIHPCFPTAWCLFHFCQGTALHFCSEVLREVLGAFHRSHEFNRVCPNGVWRSAQRFHIRASLHYEPWSCLMATSVYTRGKMAKGPWRSRSSKYDF